MARAGRDSFNKDQLDSEFQSGRNPSKSIKADEAFAEQSSDAQQSATRRKRRIVREAQRLHSGKAYLSVKEVAERFSVKPATIWNWVRKIPNFPKPVSISPGTTRWRAADIVRFEREHLGD